MAKQTLQDGQSGDTMGANEVDGSTRYATRKKPRKKKPLYIKVDEQAWRQIQAQRMQLYGGKFDQMPFEACIFANDRFFLLQNFDETTFLVLAAVDPATNSELVTIIREELHNGTYEGDSTVLDILRRKRSANDVYNGNNRNTRARGTADDISGRSDTGRKETSGDGHSLVDSEAGGDNLTKFALRDDENFDKNQTLQRDIANGTIEATHTLGKDERNGERRTESRAEFYKRAKESGLEICEFEGSSIAYGYRAATRYEKIAQQVQEGLTELGIPTEISDGSILWNLNDETRRHINFDATTVEGKLVLVDANAEIPSRNIVGHEAFHFWKRNERRNTYVTSIEDNLIYHSEAFRNYQAVIANDYFGYEVDIADDRAMMRLQEEVYHTLHRSAKNCRFGVLGGHP